MKNDNKNKLLGEWEKAMKAWASAMKKGDTEVADIMQQRANEAYKQYKDEADYETSIANSTAAELGSMFESVLPTLFVKNKKAVGDILKLIKEDSNIKAQLQFFEAMKNYDGSIDAKEYINESLNLASKNINPKTLKESNKKLGELMLSHNVRPDELISENKENFFNAGTYLLTHKKNLNNLSELAKQRTIVENYIVANKKEIDENKVNIKKITEDFDKKMAMLSEEEKSLVQDIINSNSSIAEKRQMKFFNDLKEKCLDVINKMINESSEEEKHDLQSIKEEISSMAYCKESIIKDTAKLLEVGAVLSDNNNKKYM
jgi:hypothetical protein